MDLESGKLVFRANVLRICSPWWSRSGIDKDKGLACAPSPHLRVVLTPMEFSTSGSLTQPWSLGLPGALQSEMRTALSFGSRQLPKEWLGRGRLTRLTIIRHKPKRFNRRWQGRLSPLQIQYWCEIQRSSSWGSAHSKEVSGSLISTGHKEKSIACGSNMWERCPLSEEADCGSMRSRTAMQRVAKRFPPNALKRTLRVVSISAFHADASTNSDWVQSRTQDTSAAWKRKYLRQC